LIEDIAGAALLLESAAEGRTGKSGCMEASGVEYAAVREVANTPTSEAVA